MPRWRDRGQLPGVPAKSFTVKSSTPIVAITAKATAGLADVQVINQAGPGKASRATVFDHVAVFDYVAPKKPAKAEAYAQVGAIARLLG
jgi:hypothetical protein